MRKKISADSVVKSLVSNAKHKNDKVFVNELVQFLNSGKPSYYFLSEDYYEHRLLRDETGLKLIVVSENPEIQNRTAKANAEIVALFS